MNYEMPQALLEALINYVKTKPYVEAEPILKALTTMKPILPTVLEEPKADS